MSELKLPTNLAYSRSITPSVAAFFSFNSEKPQQKNPLLISELTSVGTISNYKDIHKDNGKSIENSNPQKVDSCYLPLEHDSFEMKFTVAFSGESQQPHSCNCAEFRGALNALTSAYQEKGGYRYLAQAYLNNILSAKMLWRNGLADDITVSVSTLRSDLPSVTKASGEAYDALLDLVANALSGQQRRVVIEVVINAWVGNGQEVFPSQEFVQKSAEKGAKSKTLARTHVLDSADVAAMHSQKIGNAIRQIDIWYDGFDDLKKPLAIDPACVNKSEFKAYRLKNTKRDLYTLFEKKLTAFIAELNETKPFEALNHDIHFVVANLIRGGVFGGK